MDQGTMSKTDDMFGQDDEDLVENAQAICNCLGYLIRETERFDFPDAARYIEMAYDSIMCSLSELESADRNAHPAFLSSKPDGLPN